MSTHTAAERLRPVNGRSAADVSEAAPAIATVTAIGGMTDIPPASHPGAATAVRGPHASSDLTRTGERAAHIIDPFDAELAALIHRQLELIGEDPAREGLLRTPERVVKSMAWLTRGYSQDVREVVGEGVFEEKHESMVLVRDIELYSMCEHHMLPFFGRAHIAYIPDRRIVGLSKIPRIVDVFARRLQVQERLTEQVADALTDVLEPVGVGVVIEAQHLCMMMRGVAKQNSSTVTSALRGSFREDRATREEFLRLVHRRA